MKESIINNYVIGYIVSSSAEEMQGARIPWLAKQGKGYDNIAQPLVLSITHVTK
jgi:hypothetical protein